MGTANIGLINTQRFEFNYPYDAKVEYLESEEKSTGRKQYIDTGILSQSGLRANVTFMWLSNSIGYDNYILAQSGNTRCYFGTYQSKWMFGYRNYKQVEGIQENVIYSAEMTWYQGTSYLNIDNTRLITIDDNTEISNNGTMLIFSRQTNHNSWAAHARIYGCKIWVNDNLVRDYIPVRIANEGALYDKISNQLFRNIGTGNFTCGSDQPF